MRNRILISFLLCLSGSSLHAQWSQDSLSDIQLSPSGYCVKAVSDSNGGVFMGVRDYCLDCNYIYYIDKSGYQVWDNPVHFQGIYEANENLDICYAGNKQVIGGITDQIWVGEEAGRPYWKYKLVVQKFDSLGQIMWDIDNVRVTTDTSDQYDYEMISDNAGGVFLSWSSELSKYDSLQYDRSRYIQHISANGERLWGDTGILVLEDYGVNEAFRLYYDNGLERLFVLGIPEENHYLIQCRDINGEILWESPAPVGHLTAKYLTDIEENLIIIGIKVYDTYYRNLEMYSINQEGEIISNDPIIIADNVEANSEIIDANFYPDTILNLYWREKHNGSSLNYFQRYSYQSGFQFTQPLNIFGFYDFSFMNADTFGILVGQGSYAQKLDFSGNKQWGENGIQLSISAHAYDKYVSDGAGGLINIWDESLNGSWGQQINRNGTLGEVLLEIDNYAIIPKDYCLGVYPNPFNSTTEIKIIGNSRIQGNIVIYDLLGKVVKRFAINSNNSTYKVKWCGDTNESNMVSTGMYIVTYYSYNQMQINKYITKVMLIK